MSNQSAVICPLRPQAKWAFTTRRVDRAEASGLERDVARAVSGDLLLGRIDVVGAHRRLQLAEGRFSDLYEGDLVVVACGDRYASDQFEGIAQIDPAGIDLLAGGGVAGLMRERHERMSQPTRVTPIGLLLDAEGHVINVARFALPVPGPGTRPLVVGLIGAAMNSGKTTAAASLMRGLTRAGLEVAGIKGTGTGSFGDVNAYADAGACFVADFTDAGLVSTYRQPLTRIEAALAQVLGHASGAGVDVAVVELADGILQEETAGLLRSASARRMFDGFLFAAPDALAVAAACTWLGEIGIVPVAATGLVSRSPLASAEVEAATGLAVVTRDDLLDPAGATALVARVRSAGTASLAVA